MDYSSILQLCDSANWQKADAELNVHIRKNPDRSEPYALAAHVTIRQGKTSAAKWLINKAQSLEAQNSSAIAEDICLDFYEARYELAHKKLFPALLKNIPEQHPIWLVSAYLSCLYNDDKLYKNIPKTRYDEYIRAYLSGNISEIKTPDNNLVKETLACLDSGDKLMACLIVRFAEILFPAEANTYASLGIFNLNAGYYENAARNFHEAIFRKTDFPDIVMLHKFFLFCRQQNFKKAVKLAFTLEKKGKLNIKAQAFLLYAMLLNGNSVKDIKERLVQLEKYDTSKITAYINVLKLRLGLIEGYITREQAVEQLKEKVDKPNCPASYLYLYAELISKKAPKKAASYAECALNLEPIHHDAEKWDKRNKSEILNFEYAGLFIPKEHEGGAWPTKTQNELLEIMFTLKDSELAGSWREFTEHHSLYTLEAGAARLLPMIYKKLSVALKPEEISQYDLLSGIWKKSYFENALRLKTMLQIVQDMESKGINIILLKGMANALFLYDDLGARPMADIDILISESQLEVVDSYLRTNGWLCDDNLSNDRVRFSYAMTYRHHNGTIIDVHWRPCENLNADFYDESDIGELHHIEFLGRKWAVLSPTMNLLCTILHGVDWNHLSPVRWISDSLILLKKFGDEIDWERIYTLAKKYHCMPILATGLKFLAKFDTSFKKSLPKDLIKEMNKNYEDEPFMKIRLQAYSNLASFDEAYTILEFYKKRFSFKDSDHVFICGGDKPDVIKNKCAEYGINWAPYYNKDAMLAAKDGIGKKPFNLIAINANQSCTFNCLRVRD